MQQQSSPPHWNRTTLIAIGLEILVVLTFLSLSLLLKLNMNWNELNILPSARHDADPTWMAGDWYLNQTQGYRGLFQTLFGPLIVSWGFLTTSIVGRLISYSLVASGLVFIARKLGLNLLLLLLALTLFFYRHYYRGFAAGIGLEQVGNIYWVTLLILLLGIGLMLAGKKLGLGLSFPLLLLSASLFLIDNGDSSPQGLVAGEWLVGGLEPKVFTYGLVLLAIGLMLSRRYRLMALLLGVATSFHALVGVYNFLTVLGWLILRRKTRLANLRELGLILLLYLVGSAFAIKPILEELFASTPAFALRSSYIYVFLRVPHHLSPLSWPSNWWVILIVYLLILASSAGVIWLNRPTGERSEQYVARTGLFEFTLLSLILFVLGLVVTPFDSQGRFLQYYPFRLGDIMLPLNTCLLFVCAL